MADNSSLPVASGNETFANDDIGGIKYPRPKINWGPDGTANDVDVASGKPLPAQIRSATGLIPIGEPTDAAATATDTTSVTAISLWKQISKTLQAMVSAASTGLFAKITDGTNTATVKAVSTAPVTATDQALVTVLRPDSAGVLATVTSDQAASYAAPALRIVPQEVHLGETGGKTSVVSVTLSTDTSAYASGDLIADTQQIDAFFRKPDGTGIINSINIIDEDNQGVALYVIFMSTSTSLGTENSAPNISDANLTAGFQGIVAVATTDYVTISGTKVATIKNIGLPVKAVSGTDDIYIAVLNATGTPTFTASGLEMRIGVLLD